jgi:hypothetical protein
VTDGEALGIIREGEDRSAAQSAKRRLAQCEVDEQQGRSGDNSLS